MNHFCSSVDSLDSGCSPDKASDSSREDLAAKLEFPTTPSIVQDATSGSWFQSRFHQLLDQFQSGTVTLVAGDNRSVYGNTADKQAINSTVVVADPATYRRVILGSMLGAAESYIDGQWSSDDLTSLIRIMINNLGAIQKVDRTWSRAKNVWNWGRHLLHRNTLAGSRKNIHAHYDLGNDFYQLFLDPSLSYSSAIFEDAALELDCESRTGHTVSMAQLHDASVRKLDVVCQKLNVTASDHVVEIGTGWGAMAIHLASTTGCRVTTTTISQEQYHHAVKRVNEAGLNDRVTVLQKDYRQLTGQYDKLVSIEMIEAVGHQYFDQFFATCSKLLRPGGQMLLQSILIAGQHYQDYIRRTDFIRRYIFPGGCLPSVAAIQQSIDRVTDFQLTGMTDHTQDYAMTLQVWRKTFMNKLNQVHELGHDQKFVRLWHFYLCYCEAAFRERRTNLAQFVFEKPAAV